MSICSKCNREFAETGFCPYDGTPLVENNSQTIADSSGPRTVTGTDDMPTRPHLSGAEGEARISAVESVLQGVLNDRRNAPDSLIGADLDGRYRIEKLIGEGGMGMVYMARHIVIEKPVAVKVLRAEVAVDEAVAKRFVQEARAASRIGHPNIVDVTDFGTTKSGLTYQVMEFLEGQTLTDLIRKTKPLPIQRTLGIIVQMARALGAAHEKSIVHRDLKPDNIFLITRDGREDFVKIVDFGIAKVPPRGDDDEERLTQVGTVFGTPEYMSPEQASGRVDVDLRADVYAVGTILYEMLVGRVPHKGETTVSTLAMQILDDPKPPREARPELEVSIDLENVVMRALDKDREKRFQTMQEMLDALAEATSKTELDLPLLLKQERNSANQERQGQFDTVPEVGASHVLDEAERSRSQPVTSVRDLERQARASKAPRAKRSSRVTDPVFLRQASPSSVPMFDPIVPEAEPVEEKKSSKAPWIVLAVLLIGGGVGAFAMTRGGAQKSAAAPTTIDAGAIAEMRTPADAAIAPSPEPVDAAASEPVPDAIRSAKPVTPTRRRPTPPESTKPGEPAGDLPTGMMEVTIITKPRGGRLVIKKAYAGSDGLNLHRPAGTELTVQCRLSGYADGSVKVRFDGKKEVFLCKLKPIRTKRCVDGIQNPFDDCP